MEYVELEDSLDGSGMPSGFWERSLLGDELMTGSDLYDPRLSVFTLTLLQDSGWYQPYYKMADEMLFGLKEGCGFVENKCRDSVKHPEFCEIEDERSCGDYGDSAAICKTDKLTQIKNLNLWIWIQAYLALFTRP